jgi:hypothetical protein
MSSFANGGFMRRLAWILTLLALPLSAQNWEVGVFAGQQAYHTISFQEPTLGSVEFKPDDKVVGALRLGYAMADLGPCLLQINAGYQFKASSDIKASAAGVEAVVGKLDHTAPSLGLAFIFKAVVSASVGVDYRWEKLEGTISGLPGSASTTYGRGWVRGNVGYAIPTPSLKPFIGVEVAAPLASTSVGAAGPATDEEALKALAPKLQAGLYLGLRF